MFRFRNFKHKIRVIGVKQYKTLKEYSKTEPMTVPQNHMTSY